MANDPVTETRNYLTITVGPFQVQFSRILRSGGLELLKTFFEEKTASMAAEKKVMKP